MFSNVVYDRLKWLAQIGFPTFGALYFALAGIWGLPDAEQVIGSVTAIDAALGAVLSLSSSRYMPPTQGRILHDQTNPDNPLSVVEFNEKTREGLNAQLAASKVMTFRVDHAVPEPPVNGPPPAAA